MSIFTTIAKGAATLGGTAYDYLTPGAGSSRVTKWGASQPKAPASMPTPNYGGSGSTTTTGAAPDLSSVYNSAYQAALAKSQTPVPRLVTMDTNAAWSKANQMATAAVSPIYQQKMSDFLASQATALTRQQQDTATSEGTLSQNLAQQLAASQLQRQRTAEDTSSSIQDTKAAQAYTGRTEGLSYDTAQRALNAGLGAAGTAESGLGQGQVSDANTQRAQQSNEEVRQSDNKIAAASTLMNRNFQDLTTSDTTNTGNAATSKTALDLNLERFIEDQGTAKTQEQQNEDLAKSADIASQSQTDEGQLVDQWLAALPSQGYNATEIANAAAIYK